MMRIKLIDCPLYNVFVLNTETDTPVNMFLAFTSSPYYGLSELQMRKQGMMKVFFLKRCACILCIKINPDIVAKSRVKFLHFSLHYLLVPGTLDFTANYFALLIHMVSNKCLGYYF